MYFITESGNFMGEAEWLMRIEGALDAHFIQADGSSRPGTDWSVGIKHGDKTYNVMVRAYLSADITRKAKADNVYQGNTVMDYLHSLIGEGWLPDQPRNLAITIQNPTDPNTLQPKKSKWRFW